MQSTAPKEKIDRYLEERVSSAASLILDYLDSKETPLRIVDMGCGDGRAMDRMLKILVETNTRLEKIYAIDIQPVITDTHNIQVIRADLNEPLLPIPSNTIDIVYSLETIEHLINPIKYVKEIHRILIDQGIVVLSTPNLLAWYNRLLVLAGSMPIHYEVTEGKKYGRYMAKNSETVHHIRVFSPRALSELLNDNGFEVLKIKGLKFVFERGKLLDAIFSNFPSFSSCFSIAAKKVLD